MKTRDISLGAVLCAVVSVMLLITSYLGTMRLAALFASTLLMCALVCFANVKTMLLCYVSSALIVWLFVPDKSVCIAYSVFFGNYAAVKFFIEKLHSLTKEWIAKIACACVYGAAIYLLMCALGLNSAIKINLFLYAAAVIFIFVIGDVALSFLIGTFISKIPFRSGEKWH